MSTGYPVWIYPTLLVVLAVGLYRLRWALDAAGRPVAYLAIVMVVGSLLAQSIDESRRTFPFTTWTMYGRASAPTSAWATDVITASGTEHRGPTLAVGGSSTRALYLHIYARASRIHWEATTSETTSAATAHASSARQELIGFFEAAVQTHSIGDRDPIEAVSLVRCDLSGVRSEGRRGIDCDESTRITVRLFEDAND